MTSAIRSRDTLRKRLIRQALETEFAHCPVLLDELRWAVRIKELGEGDAREVPVTRSWMNSFARTIREQFPDHTIQKIAISESTPVGLVARAALYRLKELDALQQFLGGEEPWVLCRFRTNMAVDEPRFQLRYVTPHYHVATFRFFDDRLSTLTYELLHSVPGTLIPATQNLSVVVPPMVTPDLQLVARVPWKLFGYHDPENLYEVDPIDPLNRVQRNRWW